VGGFIRARRLFVRRTDEGSPRIHSRVTAGSRWVSITRKVRSRGTRRMVCARPPRHVDEVLVEVETRLSPRVRRSQGREPTESMTCPPKADISGDLAVSSS
jgi:hypothetical protein